LASAGIEEHFHPPENSSLLSRQYLLPLLKLENALLTFKKMKEKKRKK